MIIMKKYLYLLVAAMMTVTATAFASCSDDDDNTIDTENAIRLRKALDAIYPGASERAEWEKDQGYFVAEFDNKYRQDVEVWFADDAKWVMTQTDLERIDQLPQAVQAAFNAGGYSDYRVDDVDYYERFDGSFYVIEAEKAGQPDTELFYKDNGEFIKAHTGKSIKIYPHTKI